MPSLSAKLKVLLIFSHCALFDMRTRVSFKYFVCYWRTELPMFEPVFVNWNQEKLMSATWMIETRDFFQGLSESEIHYYVCEIIKRADFDVSLYN